MSTEESAPRVVYVQQERPLRRFHGERDGGYTVEEYAADLRRRWATSSGTAADRLDLLLDSLGPTVRGELKCHPKATQDDPDLSLAAILNVFGERLTPAELLRKLHETQQFPREEILGYSIRIMEAGRRWENRLVTMGRPDPNASFTIRDQFIAGLADPTLRAMLREQLHRSPEATFLDIRATAIRWAEGDSAAAAPQQHVLAATAPDDKFVTKNELREVIESLKTLITQRSSQPATAGQQPPPTPRLCYSCQKPGHFARNCRSNQRRNQQGNGQPH